MISTPLSQLPNISDPDKLKDDSLFLVSQKKDDNVTIESDSISYSTLEQRLIKGMHGGYVKWTDVTSDPNAAPQILNKQGILNNFVRITTNQNVSGIKNFTDIPQTNEASGNNGREIVNVDYLNKHIGTSVFIKSQIATYKNEKTVGFNGNNNKGIFDEKLKDVIPTPNNPYTATCNCFVSYCITWDCDKYDSYGCYLNTNNQTILINGIPPRETSSTLLDQFEGSFYMKSGDVFWFDQFYPSNINHKNGRNEKGDRVIYLYPSYTSICEV